jgi:fructose-1,6-bisphosphatase/inositol monophosphatase family enzyme
MVKPTADYLSQAQKVIHKVFLGARPRLLVAHGSIDETIKDDNSPVTVLDKELEGELREVLDQFDSSIGFEGEESGKAGSEKTFWLVDPIDGTESFIRGLPGVKHMATLIDNGEPVYAYVYKPLNDELFVATKGKGAFRNGDQLHVSQRPLTRCWLELSSPLDNSSTLPVIKAVAEKINGFRIMGDHTLIAEGKIDGAFAYKPKGGPWDYAPRALILKEAGAKVANLGLDTYDFRNFDFLTIHPAAFDELMPVIMKAIEENPS